MLQCHVMVLSCFIRAQPSPYLSGRNIMNSETREETTPRSSPCNCCYSPALKPRPPQRGELPLVVVLLCYLHNLSLGTNVVLSSYLVVLSSYLVVFKYPHVNDPQVLIVKELLCQRNSRGLGRYSAGVGIR